VDTTTTLTGFLAICFGISWTIGIAAGHAGVRMEAADDLRGPLVAATMMLVPALSAAIMRWHARRKQIPLPDAGFKLGPRAAYVWIWLLAPLILGGCFALSIVLGIAAPKPLGIPDDMTLLMLVSAPTINLFATTLFTFGEEYGWTGLLLPLLLQRGLTPMQAAAIYGAIWGAWHWPLIWIGHNYPGHPIAGSILMIGLCIALGLVQTALRIHTGSVIVTSFAHACVNCWANLFARAFEHVDVLFGGVTGVVGIVVLGSIGLQLHRALRAQHPASAPVE